MKNLNLENAKKAILTADNMPISSGIAPEIDSEIPFHENWFHLGEDYFMNNDGICGPSGGNKTRSFVSFDYFPHCPVCNGNLKGNGSAGENCLCFFNAVAEYFGL